jgi:hypothetical protein
MMVRARHGNWWIVSDYRRDPSVMEHGGIVVPRDVARFLGELRAAGARWDRTVLAHELPPDWTPGQPLPRVVPEARTAGIKRAEQAGDAGAALLDATARAAGHLAVTAATQGARTALAAPGLLAAVAVGPMTLDPVIMAGIDVPARQLVTWVELARWSW